MNYKDFDAILREVIDPAVQKQFDDRARMFEQIKKPSGRKMNSKGYRIPVHGGDIIPTDEQLHPWLYNIRDYAKMLEGDVKITHAEFRNIPNLACGVCNEAHNLKTIYQLHKEQQDVHK